MASLGAVQYPEVTFLKWCLDPHLDHILAIYVSTERGDKDLSLALSREPKKESPQSREVQLSPSEGETCLHSGQ